jgi:hypothetical protein
LRGNLFDQIGYFGSKEAGDKPERQQHRRQSHTKLERKASHRRNAKGLKRIVDTRENCGTYCRKH